MELPLELECGTGDCLVLSVTSTEEVVPSNNLEDEEIIHFRLAPSYRSTCFVQNLQLLEGRTAVDSGTQLRSASCSSKVLLACQQNFLHY